MNGEVIWQEVWPDWAIFCTLCNFLKPLATINIPKSPTFLGNFCKGLKIYHFSREIILHFYRHLAIFSGHTALTKELHAKVNLFTSQGRQTFQLPPSLLRVYRASFQWCSGSPWHRRPWAGTPSWGPYGQNPSRKAGHSSVDQEGLYYKSLGVKIKHAFQADVINKLKRSIVMLCWNKAYWWDATSHVTCFNQSVCSISTLL